MHFIVMEQDGLKLQDSKKLNFKMMKKIKLATIVASLLLSNILYSQITTNGVPENNIGDTNLFLDASNFNNVENSLGKGLGFPRVDLTKFVFDTTVIDQYKIYSDFDGMLVYNSSTGKTLQGQGQQVDVEPGFYYFSNPGNPRNITNGKWIRLQTDAAVGGTEDTSIYKNNGTLASDRTVNLNGNKLVFTGDGNVGIGTASPNSKLNVRGGTLNIGNLTEYAGGLQVQNQDASKPVFTAYGTDNVEKMRIANNGDIGIGTNSPTQRLDVNGTARIRNKMMIGTDWTGGGALSVRNNVASDNIATFVSADNSYKAVLKDNGNFGIGTNSPTQKLDVAGTARLRDVPNGNAENDKVLVIDNNGVVKKSSLPPSPSFALYATSNNSVWRNADGVARALDLANTRKIYTDYIERVNANTFRVKKNGVYTIEVWAKFANIPVAGDGPRTGCTLRVSYGGDGVQLLGNRWAESSGTANVTKTVILNAGQQISTQTRCNRTGNQQYQTAPGSSIFITYLPL